MARGLRRVATIAGAMSLVVLCVATLLVALGSWWFAPDAGVAAQYPLIPSEVDFDGDGVDDYTDLLDGARAEAEAAPIYDSGYYEGGYPPEDRGACTDTVWRAFAAAGYDLKAMVDADIAHDPAAYAQVAPSPDPNIDFRRVGVLSVFFSRYATGLSCDTSDAPSGKRATSSSSARTSTLGSSRTSAMHAAFRLSSITWGSRSAKRTTWPIHGPCVPRPTIALMQRRFQLTRSLRSIERSSITSKAAGATSS